MALRTRECRLLRRLKGARQCLHTQAGVPPPRSQRKMPVPRLCSLSHSVKVIRRFVDRGGEPKSPKPPAAPAVARCPRRCAARGALGSRDCEDPGGLQQPPLLFHLRFVCFERRARTFPLAPRRLSLAHKRALTRSPLPPSPGFSRERQLDAVIHLQQSSLRRALLEFPGCPRSAGSGVDRF